MILYNSEWWIWEGFAVRRQWYGWVTLKPSGRFPGYGQLRNVLTDEIRTIRLDCIPV